MPVSRSSRATAAAPVALAALIAVTVTACTSGGDLTDQAAATAPGEQPEHRAAPEQPPAWDTGPESLAALGDSITTGFDACSILVDCPEVSWATGTEPGLESLAQLLPAEEAWNEAVSGARMADLPEQARRAVAHEPELLTVMIGANDACAPDVASMTPVGDFRSDFTEAMDIIRGALPTAQIYVASVPDLHRLWTVGQENALARQIWRFGICPSMLGRPSSEEAEEATARRAAVRERVQEFNAVLREVCAADERCRYDEGAVFEYPFTTAELSRWDWFHPGVAGQQVLAELAHERITSPD
ncbi:SGNH/GDSL hydrolase family protein [Streptomyces aidingensis]|uniref:Lysophospholipase L1 n=1 Tax=Streptomyces aidingensis TaxID=910347 RepID=A0A1I1G301_9ACTN|nr:SGNH/GDSL hydrolase family protein [Streptomyces aidingensis]SFC03683.1 Lysophospholipase L1 [Streptomyces aidingensis]